MIRDGPQVQRLGAGHGLHGLEGLEGEAFVLENAFAVQIVGFLCAFDGGHGDGHAELGGEEGGVGAADFGDDVAHGLVTTEFGLAELGFAALPFIAVEEAEPVQLPVYGDADVVAVAVPDGGAAAFKVPVAVIGLELGNEGGVLLFLHGGAGGFDEGAVLAEFRAAGDGLGDALGFAAFHAVDDLDRKDDAVNGFKAGGVVETKEAGEPGGGQGFVAAGGFDLLGHEERFDGRAFGVGDEAFPGVGEVGGGGGELVGFGLRFARDADGLVLFHEFVVGCGDLEEDAGAVRLGSSFGRDLELFRGERFEDGLGKVDFEGSSSDLGRSGANSSDAKSAVSRMPADVANVSVCFLEGAVLPGVTSARADGG